MKKTAKISGWVAISAAFIAVGVIVYLQIGASVGQRWSSFGDQGPHLPFTIFSLSPLLAIASFAAFVVLQIKSGRHPR
jgi:hypothetical protein